MPHTDTATLPARVTLTVTVRVKSTLTVQGVGEGEDDVAVLGGMCHQQLSPQSSGHC